MICIVIFLLLAPTHPVCGQEPTPFPSDDEVNVIAKKLYCPVCENIPLDVCPTAACEQWRTQIREKLALGWTEQQIIDYFVAQYGDRVIAEPPRRGMNWLFYIAPPMLLAIATFFIYRIISTHRELLPITTPEDDDHSRPKDEYIDQIEDELRKRY